MIMVFGRQKLQSTPACSKKCSMTGQGYSTPDLRRIGLPEALPRKSAVFGEKFTSRGRQLGHFLQWQCRYIHSALARTKIEWITCDSRHITRYVTRNLLI